MHRLPQPALDGGEVPGQPALHVVPHRRASTTRRRTTITPAGRPGAQCVECHMPEHLHGGRSAPRPQLAVPRPDLTVDSGTPNACNGCHTKEEESAEWAAAQIRDWVGAEKAAPPHWTAAITAGRRRTEGADKLLIDVLENEDAGAGAGDGRGVARWPGQTGGARPPLRKQLKKKRGVDPAVRTAAAASYPATEAADYVRMLGPGSGRSAYRRPNCCREPARRRAGPVHRSAGSTTLQSRPRRVS